MDAAGFIRSFSSVFLLREKVLKLTHNILYRRLQLLFALLVRSRRDGLGDLSLHFFVGDDSIKLFFLKCFSYQTLRILICTY